MINPPPPVVSIEELTAALAESLARERKLRAEKVLLRAELDGMQEIMLNVYRNTKGTIDSMQLTDGQIDSLINSLMRKSSVK